MESEYNPNPSPATGAATAAPPSAGERARERAAEAEREARGLSRDAKIKTEEMSRQIRTQARDAARDAESWVYDRADEQKSRLAHRIHDYEHAMRAAADKLGEEHEEAARSRVQQLAGGLDRAARYLEDSSPSELLDDVEEMTRRHPEIVFGSMLVLGLAASRFLKASRRRRRRNERDERLSGFQSCETTGADPDESPPAAGMAEGSAHSPPHSQRPLPLRTEPGSPTSL